MTTTTSKVVVPVNPVPAARPKVFRHGTTYPKTYQRYRVEAHTWAAQQEWPEDPVSGPLNVYARFAVAKPRTSKLTHPRGDVDNYAKSVLDVLNGRAWKDDVQIVQLTVEKRFVEPGEDPHTEVIIEERTP